MSALALPLYRLTKKSVQWRWDEDCEESYLTFCEALAQNPVVLAFPDWTRPFHLEVDASSDAVGGVLAQENEQGQVKPLAFFSSALNPAQQKYSVERGRSGPLLRPHGSGGNTYTRLWKSSSGRIITPWCGSEARKTRGESTPGGSSNWSL